MTGLMLMLLATPDSPPPTPPKVRAALALAFADATPTYAGRHARAAKEGKPLVVWVGTDRGPVAGCISVACDSFPGVPAGSAVLGVPFNGGLRRLDWPTNPQTTPLSADAVRQALSTVDRGALPGLAKALAE